MAKYRFASFLLDVDERRLIQDGAEVRLRGKLFDTLRVLVESAGRLVRKEEMMQAIWPDAVVEENNLDHCVSQLRKLFRPEKFIETVPRHGYRFLGAVTPVERDKFVRLEPAVAPVDVAGQEIKFFTTSDGVRIAYTIGGEGPPLIRAIDWLNHLEMEWKGPLFRNWLSEIMRHNTLVRYDQRGSGLSDWNVEDFSFERTVKDFEELVEEIGFDKFGILGGCQGAAVATAYAVRHPERVTRLVFTGAFANGWPAPGDSTVTEQFNALLTLTRLGWGKDNPAFRQLWTTLFRPDADTVETDWLNELQRVSTSPENAVRMLSEFPKIKILDMLPYIQCPTLVLHSRDDAAIPVQEGRLIAARIRGAKFVELPSRCHLVGPADPAWAVYVEAFSNFLEWEDARVPVKVSALQDSSRTSC